MGAIFRDCARFYVKAALCHVLYKLVHGLLRHARMWVLRDMPHADCPRSAILGSLSALGANIHRLNHWRDDISKGKKICKMSLVAWDPGAVFLTVRDPAAIKHVLKDNFAGYTKNSPRYDIFWHCLHYWLGNGIFTSQHGVGAEDGGTRWAYQRKLTSNIFTREKMRTTMTQVFVQKGYRFREVLTQKSGVVDLQKLFFCYTMDSIMKLFFLEDCDTLGGQEWAYGSAFDEAHRSMFKYVFEGLPFFALCDIMPFPFGGLHGLAMQAYNRVNPQYRQFVKQVAVLDEESQKVIDKCRRDLNLANRTDVLALYLNAVAADGMNEREANKFLRDAVLNLVIAGRDTTACTLSWMFFILATNPDIQERVRAEVDLILPRGADPTLEMLSESSMPCLHALLYETLRLYPPVPFDGKTAMADDVLPDGTRIPKGAAMEYFAWISGRDSERYPDPEKVVLERWIPFRSPPPHEFPVFQAGPRICLGMDMAIFESKVAAAMLLQDFTFSMAAEEAAKVTYAFMITMSVCNSPQQDSHNLWIAAKPR